MQRSYRQEIPSLSHHDLVLDRPPVSENTPSKSGAIAPSEASLGDSVADGSVKESASATSIFDRRPFCQLAWCKAVYGPSIPVVNEAYEYNTPRSR